MASIIRSKIFLPRIIRSFGFNKIVCKQNVDRNAYLHLSSSLLGTKGIKITMPALSPTMTEGTIVNWLKKEGDTISPGDAICEVQTDKAVVFFEMEEEGILAKILMPSDSKDVKIGSLIALMVEEGQDWKNVDIPTGTAPAVTSTESVKPAETSKKLDDHSSEKHHGVLGPAVRTLLEQYNLSANNIQATGPHNTLIKGDVLKYIEQNKLKAVDVTTQTSTSPQKPAQQIVKSYKQSFVDIPNTNMRKTIAKRLTLSKTTIPHSYMNIDCQIAKVQQLRNDLKSQNIMVSVNDFIIKAAAAALVRVPAMNINVNGSAIEHIPTVDISVAVATEGGLITPIVKNANILSVPEISAVVKELAGKARQGKLQPHEFQGGSFSISNLGMFGVKEFSAVINPPQAAILAVGTSRLVPTEGGVLTKMMTTLSYDARAVDESIAAEFLEVFRVHLENPELTVQNFASIRQRAY